MHFILDHLLGALVTGTVILLLFFAGQRRQHEAVAVTARYGDGQRAAAFTEVLERDLRSTASLDQTQTEEGQFALVVSLVPRTGEEQRVEYRAVPTEGGLVRIQRYADGAEAGASAPLAGWSITALDSTGAPAATPEAARQLAARLTFVRSPSRAGAAPDTVVWETAIHPPLLRGAML